MSKTILITGSTDGIGKLAAIKLAKDGHKIIVHGRNTDKLSRVIEEIKKDSRNENVSGYVADFSDLEKVKKMATTINEEQQKIDVLINNAGVLKSKNIHNKQGIDLRYVVNYLAPYVLTKELIPLIEKGSEGRIINLSSAAQASVSYEVLAGRDQQTNSATYAQSKLALTMWSFHLAKVLNGISVIAVNPGSLLDTNMVREGYGYSWSSAAKGANIIHDLAVSDEYIGVTGKYFDNDKGEQKGVFGDAHADAYDEAKIKKLIELTEALL